MRSVVLLSLLVVVQKTPVGLGLVVSGPSSARAEKRTASLTVPVELGERGYPIYIGPGLLEAGAWCSHISGRRVGVVTNEVVGPLYLSACVAALEGAGKEVVSLVLPDGEEHKSMKQLERTLDFALESKLDRASCLVALGGGVIGDLVGFAAAVYQRGVDFVQIPTTLMAMVDSSVGGKTAVNHPRGKNMIGAFYQPICVVADVSLLDTLPDREFNSGLSEVIKYGLIRDAGFFEWQEANVGALVARDPSAVAHAVEQSCRNKAAVVAEDEREAGVRATLNLGHTFGHAVETCSGYGTYLHGEAVAIGTAMAADMSRRLGWIDEALERRAVDLLRAARLPTSAPRKMTPADFLDIMAHDKKVKDGQLRLILLKGELGSCVFTPDFDTAKLQETLHAFTTTTAALE
ncbi:hypothetical protein CTAYLR_004951 [Chrysophaeum taylorii]|uniref:3-dehydroquinate synthase, chloroplastic n=1 Tax=Chrysophaeum taylorii TaxID=2483200 RepID=A0AAD7UR19_9STRA|nr:hypothetical protein CTAYLR_004951 [Chrysophaeum taylorii]